MVYSWFISESMLKLKNAAQLISPHSILLHAIVRDGGQTNNWGHLFSSETGEHRLFVVACFTLRCCWQIVQHCTSECARLQLLARHQQTGLLVPPPRQLIRSLQTPAALTLNTLQRLGRTIYYDVIQCYINFNQSYTVYVEVISNLRQGRFKLLGSW